MCKLVWIVKISVSLSSHSPVKIYFIQDTAYSFVTLTNRWSQFWVGGGALNISPPPFPTDRHTRKLDPWAPDILAKYPLVDSLNVRKKETSTLSEKRKYKWIMPFPQFDFFGKTLGDVHKWRNPILDISITD